MVSIRLTRLPLTPFIWCHGVSIYIAFVRYTLLLKLRIRGYTTFAGHASGHVENLVHLDAAVMPAISCIMPFFFAFGLWASWARAARSVGRAALSRSPIAIAISDPVTNPCAQKTCQHAYYFCYAKFFHQRHVGTFLAHTG